MATGPECPHNPLFICVYSRSFAAPLFRHHILNRREQSWGARGGPMQVRNLDLSRKPPKLPQAKYLHLKSTVIQKLSSSRGNIATQTEPGKSEEGTLG